MTTPTEEEQLALLVARRAAEAAKRAADDAATRAAHAAQAQADLLRRQNEAERDARAASRNRS